MYTTWLILGVLLSGGLHIGAEYWGPRRGVYLFKLLEEKQSRAITEIMIQNDEARLKLRELFHALRNALSVRQTITPPLRSLFDQANQSGVVIDVEKVDRYVWHQTVCGTCITEKNSPS